jgi:hypothetical protein
MENNHQAPLVTTPEIVTSSLDIRNNEIVDNILNPSSTSIIALELNDFLNRTFPPRELILTPWLPKAGLCMIHAFRGIGKTHLSLGIAYAVAKGSEFLGWKAPMPRNVLFIDGEMPACVLQERLIKISLMHSDESLPGKLRIITPDLQKIGMPDISTAEGQKTINQFITDEIDLVIVDNISCLAPSIKENDATDWVPIQTWALNLRARGKSVILIHHSGKAGTQRGTSRKEDVLDTVIGLERPKDYDSSQGARFIVRYEKSRGFYGNEAKPFEAHLCNDDNKPACWITKNLEESNYEKVILLINDGYAQIDIVKKLELSKGTVSKYVSRAREEGLLKNIE